MPVSDKNLKALFIYCTQPSQLSLHNALRTRRLNQGAAIFIFLFGCITIGSRITTCVLLAVWLTWKSNLDCKRGSSKGHSVHALLNLLWNWQKRGKLPSWLIESFVVPLHLQISSELAIIRCINYVLIDIARKAIAIIMIGALHRSQTYCLPVIGLVCTLRYIFLHFYCFVGCCCASNWLAITSRRVTRVTEWLTDLKILVSSCRRQGNTSIDINALKSEIR